jgi:hypothetical protein
MAMGNIKSGTYTGTGAAITIEMGFIPLLFLVWNETDGDDMYLWMDGMAAATAIKISTAVASQGSNAVTRYTGLAGTTGSGLTVGTALSESAKTWRYIAIGENV